MSNNTTDGDTAGRTMDAGASAYVLKPHHPSSPPQTTITTKLPSTTLPDPQNPPPQLPHPTNTPTPPIHSALPNTDLQDSIHEDAKPRGEPAGTKTQGTGVSAFSSGGAIGKAFTTEGAVGGTAEKIGGPLSSQGMVGKQFTEGGSIGGSVQSMLGDKMGKETGSLGQQGK